MFNKIISLIFVLQLTLFTSFLFAEDKSFFGKKDFSADSLFSNKSKSKDVHSKFDKKGVLAVSIIVNAQKPRLEQAKKELEEFYEFCVSKKILPLNVYIIWPPFSEGLNIQIAKLMMLGADIHYSLPDYLSEVKYVPSYVTFTNNGYYILDGIKNINKIVNSTGKFFR